MSPRRCRRAVIAAAAFLVAAPLGAVTRDEIVALARAGVGDAVIVSKIKADGSRFDLSVQDILDLKKAGVGDAVLEAMLAPTCPEPSRGSRVEGPAPGVPAAVGAARAEGSPSGRGGEAPAFKVGPVAKAEEAPDARGTLVLSNQDDRSYSVMLDEEGRMIFYYYGSAADRIVLSKGESRTLTVPAGLYRVRWVGAGESFDAPVRADQTTKLVTTGVKLAAVESVQLTILAGDREVAAGTLRKFREVAAEPAPAPEARPAPQPAPPESKVTIYESRPSPPVVYVEPSYCAPRYSSFYYGSDCWPSYTYSYYSSPGCAASGYERRGLFGVIGPHTVVGAGLGAVIDRRNRGRGAAVGAVFGHLLDHSWCR